MASQGIEQKDGNSLGLSNPEIATRTRDVLTSYATLSHERIRPPIRRDEGKAVIGYVRSGREAQHMIDAVGENLLADLIRQHNLPSLLIGENNTWAPIQGSENLVDFAIDPIDNTSPYVRGLDTPMYSVVGAYNHRTRNPIGAVAVDIVGNKIYRAARGKVTVMDIETEEVKDLSISRRTQLSDPDITIASFVSEKEYSLPFFDNFRPMIEGMSDKGYLYPGGGAFVYALMAKGAVDAYVMVNEPRSEIDPGLPLFLTGGGKAVSVDPETGKRTPYKFDPELMAADESVPFFLAYAQEAIADQIIAKYLEGKKLAEEQQAALKLYRELEMRPGEEYHLTDYLRQLRESEGYPPIIPAE